MPEDFPSADPPSAQFPTAGLQRLSPGDRVFGRFILIAELGRGAMGVVFSARDEVLGAEVALKFVPDFLRWNPSILAGLRDEVRQARTLSHPHIVRVYELHQDALSAAIAMEYVEGQSLREFRLARPGQILGPEEILPWLGGLADALDYAHREAGLIHRDLKPANILLTQTGAAKLSDFGLARRAADEVSQLSQWQPCGTLPFMSPQQLAGDPPSAADDIYALGATLYECLTGRPPFHSGYLPHQIESRSPDSIAGRRRSLGIKAPPVPRSWETAVAACLAKDPADRPASARALLEALEGRRVLPPPRSAGAPSARPSLRERLVGPPAGLARVVYAKAKAGV
ncbi:MAG: serine/threonine protein kinase, partial [Puniceicoccaceae bacterium]